MIRPVILAAGASTRLGRPKALVRVGGTPALERIVVGCDRAGWARPVVVLGSDAEAILAVCDPSRMTVVVHEDWAAGRTSSLKAGLRAVPDASDDVILYPVDHPFVRIDTLEALAGAWAGRDRALHRVAQPVHSGRRGHPVVCASELRAEFLALGDEDPASAVTRRDPGRVLEVPVDDPGVVENVDTLEDLARSIRRFEPPGS